MTLYARILILGLFTLGSSFADPASNSSIATPSGSVGKFTVTVTRLSRAQEWSMMPGNDFFPKVKAKEGHVLIVVAFEVIDAEGKPDTDASFKGFALKSADGSIWDTVVKDTDIRAVPIGVPTHVAPTHFIIEGTEIDVTKVPIE